jgi:D-alanyl-D-alanine carboxypeptidase
MTRRSLVLLLLVPSLTPQLIARSDNIDDFIRDQMTRQNIPGLSLAVVKDGTIVKAAGYGVADRKRQTATTPETVYKIASVSKQFIAAGIMLLVQEGRLGLDDPITKYLDGAPVAWTGVTIRHLLTHTSGLVREAPGFDASRIQSDADVIRTAYGSPLRFAPGEKCEYSNLPYFILAEIIHKVSGRAWTEYLREKVFEPVGMQSTYPTNTRERVPNRATGYTDNDRLTPADEWAALRPSGAFLSTVLDLAKWDAALYTDRILTDASRRQMWTAVTLNDGSSCEYGFGWLVGTLRGRKLIHHGGGMPGTRSYFARFVDDRLSIIVLMNLNDVDITSIVNGVAALSLPAGTQSAPR